jgi:hypothetical protein
MEIYSILVKYIMPTNFRYFVKISKRSILNISKVNMPGTEISTKIIKVLNHILKDRKLERIFHKSINKYENDEKKNKFIEIIYELSAKFAINSGVSCIINKCTNPTFGYGYCLKHINDDKIKEDSILMQQDLISLFLTSSIGSLFWYSVVISDDIRDAQTVYSSMNVEYGDLGKKIRNAFSGYQKKFRKEIYDEDFKKKCGYVFALERYLLKNKGKIAPDAVNEHNKKRMKAMEKLIKTGKTKKMTRKSFDLGEYILWDDLVKYYVLYERVKRYDQYITYIKKIRVFVLYLMIKRLRNRDIGEDGMHIPNLKITGYQKEFTITSILNDLVLEKKYRIIFMIKYPLHNLCAIPRLFYDVFGYIETFSGDLLPFAIDANFTNILYGVKVGDSQLKMYQRKGSTKEFVSWSLGITLLRVSYYDFDNIRDVITKFIVKLHDKEVKVGQLYYGNSRINTQY